MDVMGTIGVIRAIGMIGIGGVIGDMGRTFATGAIGDMGVMAGAGVIGAIDDIGVIGAMGVEARGGIREGIVLGIMGVAVGDIVPGIDRGVMGGMPGACKKLELKNPFRMLADGMLAELLWMFTNFILAISVLNCNAPFLHCSCLWFVPS